MIITSDTHDKEWVTVEKARFADLDTNGDQLLNFDELGPWAVSDNNEEADEEVEHLFQQANKDGNDDLSEEEILNSHEDFVGSQATDYGRHLHFVKHKDEL